MTREERKKAIDALKISTPIMAMTQEEFNDYIQTLNRIMDWLEQEPKIEKVIKMRDATPEERESVDKYIKSISKPTGIDFWALEQESSEDAISRAEALRHSFQIYDDDGVGYKVIYADKIKQLPSVKPQEKIGQWITWKEAGNEIASETRFECSVCHDSAQTLCNGLDLLSPYCPNCGAKMIEPQESEVQE